jgi:hypothetical protein
MIYCVVPKPLAEELFPKLVEYYADEENVQVIVDRREFDRRARGRRSVALGDAAVSDSSAQGAGQRRIVRDRRRARVPGDLPPLARVAS